MTLHALEPDCPRHGAHSYVMRMEQKSCIEAEIYLAGANENPEFPRVDLDSRYILVGTHTNTPKKQYTGAL